MPGQSQIVTHHAILIGIDHYADKPLRGCVRDVEDTKRYLESTLRDAVKIQMITTGQVDSKLSDSADGSALWPAYDNVILAFERTTSLAREGDFVYIHYSGHGTRKPPHGEFSNKLTGDLALVLLKGREEKQVSYLWGLELARLLKVMVDKGLVVTLALDCCFSASVYRHDDEAAIRFLPYDDEIESDHPPEPGEGLVGGNPSYRDASTLPNWLINPDRYAILAACGPHEVASELKFDGVCHGAMSYFLLETIKSVGVTKKHRDIYDHMRAKFRGFGLRRQNPVLYGNQTRGFFGPSNKDITSTVVPIVVTKNGTLELQAGHAHGVSNGDEFVLQPLGPAEDEPIPQGPLVVYKVARIRALTSDLEPLDLSSVRAQTGWIAEPRTRFSLQQYPVRLPSDLPYRDELVTLLKTRSLSVSADKDPFVFDVMLNNGEEYKILDESGSEVINLPSMLQDQTGAREISDILEHLVRFRLVRGLGNESLVDPFRESYDVSIKCGERDYSPGIQIEVKHGAMAELVIHNRGANVLYVFVYDLGPLWQVDNVYHGTYAVVTSRNDGERFIGTRRIKLRMRVPDKMRELGYHSCEDIIKVFITSRPTSFNLLELPKLGGPMGTGKHKRTGQVGEGPENWVALDFPIRTSLQ